LAQPGQVGEGKPPYDKPCTGFSDEAGRTLDSDADSKKRSRRALLPNPPAPDIVAVRARGEISKLRFSGLYDSQ
jgi:hypothetical protein